MSLFDALAIDLAERGLVPDSAIRSGIRRLLAAQLERARRHGDFTPEAKAAFRERMRQGPLAVATDAANAQHYELPPAFFEPWLGRRMKYSCALWPPGVDDLDAAEEAMLELTCTRARLGNGMNVLELGCGWGSLTLWMAERYPASRLLAVTNSSAQAEFIRARARDRGLGGVEVLQCDIRDFQTSRRFDRVVSVEMFEHLRNHEEMLRRIAGWLEDDGRLFVHLFTHRELAYLYDTEGEETWMARHFFTGGMMPSEDWLAGFGRDLVTLEQWAVNGCDYARTLDAWLARLDAARDRVLPVLAGVYGPRAATRQFHRWRIFLLACSELFGWEGGGVWRVTHSLLGPAAR
jgi:cyclopropane-fatty-acyl-phospholipid synthase